jgi:glycerol-3-phosphate acyltransferase PlsX
MNVIAVDAMGGDRAPSPEVAGAVAAVRQTPVKVILCGDRDRIAAELTKHEAREGNNLEIRHASQVVTMDDSPGQAFRHKKDSSLRVAMNLVKDGEAAALVSAGNSGAIMAHSLFVLRRLPDIDRPGIVAVFPTPSGRPLVLCDVGANVEVRPTMLAQFGILGAHYNRILHKDEWSRPKVGLLSNGTELGKGTDLTRSAHRLLMIASSHSEAEFEYVGYVEGSEILRGKVDVVATDGFTGNVVLKVTEGVSEAVIEMVRARLDSSTRAKLGAKLVEPALRSVVEDIHPSRVGGALLVGIRGIVMICHGGSDSTAVLNAIKESDRFASAGLIENLGAAIERHHSLWDSEKPE